MKILLGIVAGVLVLGGGVWLYNQQSEPAEIQYTSDVFEFDNDQAQFTVQYSDTAEYMQLSFSGVQYELKQTVSGSGTTYTSEDGKVVFREHQGEATVEVDGKVIIENAIVVESSEQLQVEVTESKEQGDPNANRYDFADDGIDQDCMGEDCDDSSRATDYNSSRSNRTTAASALDSDDDGDSVPTESEDAQMTETCDGVDNDCSGPSDDAEQSYVKIEGVAGESTESGTN